MRGPDDFDELTEADLEQVKELESRVEKWFEANHRIYRVNTNEPTDPKIPRRVWEELVRRAAEAGWRASLQGAIVEITRR